MVSLAMVEMTRSAVVRSFKVRNRPSSPFGISTRRAGRDWYVRFAIALAIRSPNRPTSARFRSFPRTSSIPGACPFTREFQLKTSRTCPDVYTAAIGGSCRSAFGIDSVSACCLRFPRRLADAEAPE